MLWVKLVKRNFILGRFQRAQGDRSGLPVRLAYGKSRFAKACIH
jgi:hypothetical protein